VLGEKGEALRTQAKHLTSGEAENLAFTLFSVSRMDCAGFVLNNQGGVCALVHEAQNRNRSSLNVFLRSGGLYRVKPRTVQRAPQENGPTSIMTTCAIVTGIELDFDSDPKPSFMCGAQLQSNRWVVKSTPSHSKISIATRRRNPTTSGQKSEKYEAAGMDEGRSNRDAI
jgi:hypothetical protein